MKHPRAPEKPEVCRWMTPEQQAEYDVLQAEWIEAENKWLEPARASVILNNQSIRLHKVASEKFFKVYAYLKDKGREMLPDVKQLEDFGK